MEIAIVGSFITGILSLMGGIILLLLRRAFAFDSLEKTLIAAFSSVDDRTTESVTRIENMISKLNESFADMQSSAKIAKIFNEVRKSDREKLEKGVEEIKESIKSVSNKISSKDIDLIINKIDSIKGN